MDKNQIVPEVINKVPNEILQVSFGKSEVKVGSVLTPTKTKDTPKVTWKAEPQEFYSLCMTDPDAPSRKKPTQREWHHWLVVNIPGNNLDQAEVLSQYISPAPPKQTGLHRYVLVLYKQSAKLDFSQEPRLTNKSASKRGKFSIANFASKYQLGDPVAGTYFQAEYDDYVPHVYKSLKD